MKFIDIHAHLENPRFKKDLDSVLKRFKKSGGKFVISSGTTPTTNRKALEIAEKYNCVKVSFGLYPIDAVSKEIRDFGDDKFLRNLEKFDVDKELNWIEEHVRHNCVAIGEVGLDYNQEKFKTEDMQEKQKKNFRKVLQFAKKIDKVVVVHSRKAELDAIEILEEMKMKKVVMHCFSGKKSLIKRCVENGWSLSVPPVIMRLEHFKMLVEVVPLGNLLTETDAPFLSPVAGERNEPVNVGVTLGIIAKIKGMGKEEVAEKIWENAEELFGL